jgi:hypothetical protein
LLGTFEIRTWGRAVFSRRFCALAAGLGDVIARGLLACGLLACFASAFAAVTAIAVTRAAFAALIVFGCAGAFGRGVGVCRLVCSQSRLSCAGIGRASLWTFSTFTAAFAPALATFAATVTAFAWGALCAHFAAFGGQLGLGIAAAFAQVVGALTFSQAFAACG